MRWECSDKWIIGPGNICPPDFACEISVEARPGILIAEAAAAAAGAAAPSQRVTKFVERLACSEDREQEEEFISPTSLAGSLEKVL